jgi:GTP:adenosylcobinamide-phosphate guanylyltransferase
MNIPPMSGVIMAGHSAKEEDLLAEYSQGQSKALIPIAGRPMISYVLDALAGSRYVNHITVVGLNAEMCPTTSVPITLIPDQGSLIGNAETGLEQARKQNPDLEGVLMGGSDLPLLTSAMIDLLVDECLTSDHDLYYPIVERSVMEARFPTSSRTYVRLTDGEFAGGDIALLRKGAILAEMDLWRRLADARKNPIKQAQMAGGITTLIKLLARRLSIAEAEQRISRSFKMRCRAVPFPYAEIGMDVDKPFQLEIAKDGLEGHTGD